MKHFGVAGFAGWGDRLWNCTRNPFGSLGIIAATQATKKLSHGAKGLAHNPNFASVFVSATHPSQKTDICICSSPQHCEDARMSCTFNQGELHVKDLKPKPQVWPGIFAPQGWTSWGWGFNSRHHWDDGWQDFGRDSWAGYVEQPHWHNVWATWQMQQSPTKLNSLPWINIILFKIQVSLFFL